MKNENCARRIDNLGRLVIPSGLRKRYGINENDELAFYTLENDDGIFVCVKVGEIETSEKKKYMNVARVLKELDIPIPAKLIDKIKKCER